jgi:hypothetical protein
MVITCMLVPWFGVIFLISRLWETTQRLQQIVVISVRHKVIRVEFKIELESARLVGSPTQTTRTNITLAVLEFTSLVLNASFDMLRTNFNAAK